MHVVVSGTRKPIIIEKGMCEKEMEKFEMLRFVLKGNTARINECKANVKEIEGSKK